MISPRALIFVAVALAGFIGAASEAWAHPHVFVVVKSELIFDAQGKVSGIRHAWTFDEMYSSFVTTGLTADGAVASDAQLQPVAETNVGDLAENSYITVTKSPGQKVEFDKPKDIGMSEGADKLVTLRFTLPLKQALSAGKCFTLQVSDPSYFVAFDFAKTDAVKLVSPPSGCSLSVVQPKPLEDTEAKKLSEAYFSGLSPGSDFGIKLASRAILACP
ncbi:MAG: hypothetical protein JWL62_1616 [Hyphomicrobiales bacterium]|nr:hypothetical protein [Hyphomicrobiales bacterium]